MTCPNACDPASNLLGHNYCISLDVIWGHVQICALTYARAVKTATPIKTLRSTRKPSKSLQYSARKLDLTLHVTLQKSAMMVNSYLW